jgi:uncharacterized membrane protein
MNFLQDTTWQDDPSVVVSDITTQGSYALAVNGGFNAASLSIVQIVLTSDYNSEVEMRQIETEVSNLQVYPNPSNGLVTINDSFKDEFRSISLYNSIGSKVFSKNYNSNNYKLDFTDLPNGVYMLVITTDNGVQKQQIIKE